MADMSQTKPPQKPKPSGWRNLVWYLLFALIAVSILTNIMSPPKAQDDLNYSAFLSQVDSGSITSVEIRPNEQLITGTAKDGKSFKTYFLDYPGLISDLRSKNVTIAVNPKNDSQLWSGIFQAFLPFILIGLLWFFIFRQAQGANNQAMSFGKSRANAWKKDKSQLVTFKDVAGVDEAVEELREIVDYLKSPARYKALGAKIPKGALLMGPPGTGKTLLAKAVAGEADVPFFSLSGSDFVEMFVGVGASRVRDLFAQAKKNQPCIIFVDEIDAVGRHRGAGLGGGHDEREQTLNQLLVEMDGFEADHTIIIMAATNRPDILDPALLRPGRFDRQVVVDKPSIKGRLDILKIHARGKKFSKNIDLEVLAKRTPGFTGADLANLMNEGALLSARRNLKTVSMAALEEAIDRVMAGPQRKSRLLSQKEQEIVAYHEVGHAIIANLCKFADPVHRVSILPRGQALGYTLQVPTEDKHLISRSQIKDTIKILLGGRIAEDLIFNEITSGASNDIERATSMARDFVCKFGMSTKLGTRQYGRAQSQVFLGRDYSDHSKDYSDTTAREVDEEIKSLIDECYRESESLLKTHHDLLVKISKILIEREELNAEEFSKLMSGEELPVDNTTDTTEAPDTTTG
jgi:cell division protease FtsH